MIGFDIGEFQSLIGVDLLEDELVDMGGGDDDGNAGLEQGVDVGGVFGHAGVLGEHVEDSVLGGCLELNVLLECLQPCLSGNLISIQVNNIFLEIWINATFLDVNCKLFIPLVILLGVLFGLFFEELENSLGDEGS